MNSALLKSFQTLHQVYADRAFSVIALNKTLSGCKNQDKALITKIVYGVTENDLRLEYVLSRFVRKMPKGDVLLYLKIGVYCLMELSLPVYTVVNDTAELSKLSGDIRTVGFVNATLKSVAKVAKSFDDYPDGDEGLCIRYSYPQWAFNKLVKDYGRQTAEQLVSFPSDNRTTVRLLPGAQGDFLNAEETIFDDALRVSGNVPVDGELTVQSLSSMAISRICAQSVPASGRLLDCCAAPGGKSVYIKQLRPDVDVTSCDIHPHRVELINSYAKRMGVQLHTECCDMSLFRPEWEGAFDTVLCDVPCSGFGVLDNRPDIKLFRQSKDISELMKVQYAILDNCSRYVAGGGSLVYSTCTLFDNENGQNIRKFLANHEDFSYGSISLPQVPAANGQGQYQFLPHKDGMQGFFVAVLTRKQ